MTDLTTLSDAEARDLLAAVYADVQRREVIAAAPARAADLAAQYATAIGGHDGDAYQPVSGAHDAYKPGAVVSDGGDYYRATGWASHPPGQGPWERVWPDGDGWTTTPPADEGPLVWAVGITAVAGETVLSHEGRLWRAKISHSTHAGWPPSAATHAVWEDLGPA